MKELEKESFISWYKSTDNRFWIRIGKANWRFEWGFFKKGCRLIVNVGGEENDLMLGIAIPHLFYLFIGVEDIVPYKWLPRNWGRTTGISFFDGYISLELWRDNSGWTKQKKWQHIMINIPDVLFGSAKCTKKVLGVSEVHVSLPEGLYPARVTMLEYTWTRKRFIKPLKKVRAEIEPNISIPIPGKGENAWDIDDDAIHSLTCDARNPHDAARQLAEGAMKTRVRYASYGWKPRKGFPEGILDENLQPIKNI